ncbi:hypothetical protein D3C80_1778920 [compost metagenome]
MGEDVFDGPDFDPVGVDRGHKVRRRAPVRGRQADHAAQQPLVGPSHQTDPALAVAQDKGVAQAMRSLSLFDLERVAGRFASLQALAAEGQRAKLARRRLGPTDARA